MATMAQPWLLFRVGGPAGVHHGHRCLCLRLVQLLQEVLFSPQALDRRGLRRGRLGGGLTTRARCAAADDLEAAFSDNEEIVTELPEGGHSGATRDIEYLCARCDVLQDPAEVTGVAKGSQIGVVAERAKHKGALCLTVYCAAGRDLELEAAGSTVHILHAAVHGGPLWAVQLRPQASLLEHVLRHGQSHQRFWSLGNNCGDIRSIRDQ
mmetsp:Transcript_18735/g.41060  ORF Transcript_18735/g.41060 Transcript_18735/m.41060 type:complete len:209 (-) Transcript_18735:390-1016(-)